MAAHSLYQTLFAVSMGLIYIGIPAAIIVCKKKGNKDLGTLIATGLFILGAAGGVFFAVRTSLEKNTLNAANTEVVAADPLIQQILSEDWVLQENEDIRAQEPYLGLRVSANKELQSVGCISGKHDYDTLTAEDVAGMKTLCFSVYERTITSKYTDQYGGSRGEGSAEQRMGWLYDVESGTFFKRAPMHCSLPNELYGTNDPPNLTVSEAFFIDFIKGAM